MNFSFEKYIFLVLVLFMNTCCGYFENVGVQGASIAAGALKESIKQLAVICKGLEATLNNLGIKSEKLGGVFVDGASNVGINSAKALVKAAKITSESAQILAGAVKSVTYVAWAGVGTAASYISYKLVFGIYDRYKERNREKALCVARQALVNVLIKNAANKEGLLGLPEGCEKEASALMILPGGNNELAVMREAFIKRGNK